MARIRSIKPEFWTDGKIRRLGDPTALFFIALWTFADDYGFFTYDTLELSLQCPRWRSQSVFAMLSSLSRHGLVRLSSSSGVGQVVSWEHQRIKDRRSSKWIDKEIIWDKIPINAQGSDRIRPGVERRGKERSGVELRKGASPPAPSGPGARELIALYCELWKERYNSPKSPDIRGKTAGIFKGIVKDLGYARAQTLVQAYLQMPDSWFLTKTHDIETFTANLTKVALFADSGQMITKRQAQQIDDSQTVQQQLRAIEEGRL